MNIKPLRKSPLTPLIDEETEKALGLIECHTGTDGHTTDQMCNGLTDGYLIRRLTYWLLDWSSDWPNVWLPYRLIMPDWWTKGLKVDAQLICWMVDWQLRQSDWRQDGLSWWPTDWFFYGLTEWDINWMIYYSFFWQVILSTNIAESSLTVPDIKYGIVRANFLVLWIIFVSLIRVTPGTSKHLLFTFSLEPKDS